MKVLCKQYENGNVFYKVSNSQKSGIVIDFKTYDQICDKKNEIINSNQNTQTQQQSQQIMPIISSESEESIKEEIFFFSQFKNPINFQPEANIESVTPINIPNNETKLMISSNNDILFISPGYFKDLSYEKRNKSFNKYITSNEFRDPKRYF